MRQAPPPWGLNLIRAGSITASQLGLHPIEPQPGRERHRYGNGPFARLRIPSVVDEPGIYVWVLNGEPVYVGRARTSLRRRLGSQGYATISRYNTYERQPGRSNGGQQTNCRINALANAALVRGSELVLYVRTAVDAEEAAELEVSWMRDFGVPKWNLRDER